MEIGEAEHNTWTLFLIHCLLQNLPISIYCIHSLATPPHTHILFFRTLASTVPQSLFTFSRRNSHSASLKERIRFDQGCSYPLRSWIKIVINQISPSGFLYVIACFNKNSSGISPVSPCLKEPTMYFIFCTRSFMYIAILMNKEKKDAIEYIMDSWHRIRHLEYLQGQRETLTSFQDSVILSKTIKNIHRITTIFVFLILLSSKSWHCLRRINKHNFWHWNLKKKMLTIYKYPQLA